MAARLQEGGSWSGGLVEGGCPQRWPAALFGHDPKKWGGFEQHYRDELQANPEAWKPILEAARQGNVTLLYSARDAEHNSALLLKDFLQEHLHH